MTTTRSSSPSTIEDVQHEAGDGQLAHSWEGFYAPELNWYRHARNVLHHVPMFRALQALRPKRVLEVGAGTGSHSIFVSYFLPEVVSVDLSPQLIERCKVHNERLRGRAAFLPMDAFQLGFPNDAFDVVFSQGFFEHFPDDAIARLLHEQSRVARHVVLSVPNRSYAVRDFGNERLLSRLEWEKLLDRLGYRILVSQDYRPLRARFWRGGRDMYLAVIERSG